jgi:LPS export ABC transporter protein LptC
MRSGWTGWRVHLRRSTAPVVAMLAGLSLLSNLACVADEPVPRSQSVDPIASLELRGVVLEGFEAGVREFEVRAGQARVDPDGRVLRLLGVEIAFTEDARGDVRVTADEGRLELDDDDFELVGNVLGTTADRERFETAELRYERARHRLVTDSPVRVERPNMVLRSSGMEIDLREHRLLFTGQVEAEGR